MRRRDRPGRQSGVVLPSQTLQALAPSRRWRLPIPRGLRYVPNGIDLGRFGPGPAWRLPGEGPVIGTVAALRAEKNVGRLVRAFATGMPGRLLVVGDGPERAGLEALAAELGVADRVHWAGHQVDPAPLLRGLDAFALSSDTEQMPLSLLEAMAAGLPVASTDVGDVAAMVADANRPYIVACDDAALADALAKVVAEPALRARLGADNRARAAAQYGQARMVGRWAELLSESQPGGMTHGLLTVNDILTG